MSAILKFRRILNWKKLDRESPNLIVSTRTWDIILKRPYIDSTLDILSMKTELPHSKVTAQIILFFWSSYPPFWTSEEMSDRITQS